MLLLLFLALVSFGALASGQHAPPTSCAASEQDFYGQKTGTLVSPNYPANYPRNQLCVFSIGSPDAKKFELTFNDLSFEKGKDALAIGTGTFTEMKRPDYLYDQKDYDTLPGPLSIKGDRAWFRFNSDSDGQFRGFSVSWRIDGNECSGNPCNADEECVDGEYTFTCTGGGEVKTGPGGEVTGSGGVTGGDQVTVGGEVAGGGEVTGSGADTPTTGTTGGGAGRQCTIGDQTYPHGLEWDLDVCSYCDCYDGTAKCAYKVCPPVRCRTPIKKTTVCCHTCPPKRLFVSQVSFQWGSGSGAIISHNSNEMLVNVDIGHDANRSSLEITGQGLWKVGMYTKMRAAAGGGQISVSEQILEKRKANKKLLPGDRLKFNRLKYNLDLTDRRCVDIEEVCATFSKGDNPKPDYTLVPEPNPSILTSCQAVDCPPPPVGVTCVDDVSMTEYQDSEQWRPDPCTTCTCYSGISDCITLQCPLLDCAETRPVDGECCPQCLVEERGTCVYEGVARDSGATWAISDCINCHCNDGSISCEFFGCQCPITPEEEKNCGGYKDGDTWYQTNCIKCTCTKGEVGCVTTACPALDCTDTEQGEMDCCPRCKGVPPVEPVTPLPCSQGDQMYYHGQQWKLDDCITCLCSNGLTSCAETVCLPLDCENPVLVKGECCMVCEDQKDKIPGKPCTQNGRLYKHGTSWEVDKCTTCHCESSEVACAVVACSIPICPGRTIYDDPNECCPYCEEPEPEDVFCTYEGAEYLNKQTWKPNPCLDCSCADGVVDCFPIVCIALYCMNYELLPGECCPQCADDGITFDRGCLHEGNQYANGETFKPDPCTSCQCDNQIVTCTSTICIGPVCSVPVVTLPDQCCPICPDLFCTDETTGQRYENGERFKPDPCTTCSCTDGILFCVPELCPVLADCETYVPEGKCCAECTDTRVVKPLWPCTHESTEYASGEQWRPDPCQTCSCFNGTTFCASPGCDLPCSNPLPPSASECCGSCPEDPRCMSDGIDYGHGETWSVGPCEDCTCLRGVTACKRKPCPLVTCDFPVTQPGACCPTCPQDIVGPTCSFKGKTYQDGEQFEADQCTTCLCSGGNAKCVPVSCEPVTCPNAMLREGKCCLECPAEPCTTKSGIKAHGSQWEVDECTTCRCDQGAVNCARQTCPTLTCTPEDVPGACCDQCSGDVPCEFKGKTYVKGQRFQPSPCEFCMCLEGGGIGCVPASCPSLTCNNPIRREGMCCAVCEEGVCEYKGKEYPAGQTFNPSPCTTCECSTSLTVSCAHINCDVPNCPDPIFLEGACCPTCQNKFCAYKGKVYPEGSTFQTDPCSHCVCDDGNIDCVGTPCPMLDCPVGSEVYRPDQCCPTCAEPPPSCSYLDQTYVEGARWRVNDCRECWCQDGKIWCAYIACLKMSDCNTLELAEGKCCPECTDPPQPPTQDCATDSGLTYQHGARWYSNCGYCTCLDGVVSCVTEFCQPLTCDNQVKPEGSCCPVCVEDSQSCTLAGATYQHRAVFRINECFDCMCYNRAFYCWGSVCRKPACDNPIKVPGKCCLECPEDPAIGPLLQDCVLPDTRTYGHGTFFKTDHCTYCYCNDGYVICSREPCEAKACDEAGEVTLEGECCSTCKSDVQKCVVEGVTYSHNDRWRIGECKECYCDSGVTRCSDLMCPEVTCADAVKTEGTCCPTCPTVPTGPVCTFDGKEYTDGQQWRKNKCTLCSCTEGTVKCTADPCPALSCEDPVTVKGECCRVCPDTAKQCEIDGKTYKHGEYFRDEGCLECRCNNGAKTCNRKNCPALSCSSENSFIAEGECCPQCLGTPKRPCEVNGLKYSDGQQWPQGDCETCQCDNGQQTCTHAACPAVSCDNPVILEGECCWKCEEQLPCTIEEVEVTDGKQGVVRAATCQRCSCSKGVQSCLTEDCPVPDCENPVMTEDGCCQACPDQTTCLYKGYEFVHGQTWQKDTCTFCQCVDGATLCDMEPCPVLSCAEVIEVDGECCPRCKDTAEPCSYGGIDYDHGATWTAGCTRCSCDNGAVSCTYQNCPAITCDNPANISGECCPRCPDGPRPCNTERGVFNDGETWRINKCLTCRCTDGMEDCRIETCPVLTCADPQNVIGECCRRCPTRTRSCSVRGVKYRHKERWQRDSCTNCQCDDGTVDCVDQTCPEPSCPEPIHVDNVCCPRCPGQPVYSVCRQEGQTYSHQQEWRPDVCSSCRCDNGTVICNTENCPRLQCAGGQPIAQEGQCCKVCPEEAMPCVFNGATYEHGKSWRDGDCRVCTCKNNQTTCDFEVCSVPDCDNPIKAEGKCCLQCPGTAPPRDCGYKNSFYPHSYRWKPDVCTQCNCNDGTVSCKDVSCPEIFCPAAEEVLVEGECCPLCPDQSLPCVDDAGGVHLHGERWPISDCTHCTCLNNAITCDTQLCPKPECANILPIEGQCCDGCEGQPAEVVSPCVYQGREYTDGEWWQVDDCKSCTCEEGIQTCSFASCPRLACEGTPITVEGKCCPICPADAQFCTTDGNTTYEHGATWSASVCTDCTCNDESVSCDHEVCPTLTCTETEDVGQCCKQCTGDPAFRKCTDNGKEYKHGHVLRKNNCKKCTCEDGDWSCDIELCPKLTCSDPVSVKGQCCEKCPEDTKSCEVDGTTYKHGDKWSESPCTDCQCNNGAVVCDHQSCPVPDCADAATLEGECCPTCPGIAPFKSCRSNGQKYKHGKFWSPTDCSLCTCLDGDVHCQSKTCPRPTCDNPVRVKGECCKKCPDEMTQCQLDGNGDVRDHLDSWRVDNCKTCKCFNGKVSCDTQTCPAVDCMGAVVPENQCCPVCPGPEEIVVKSCEVGGRTYQHGQRWDNNACESCLCDNGKVVCDSPPCDALTCSNPIKVAGECCLRCSKDAQPCVTSNNVVHPHGEKWHDGDCKTCKCINGRTNCDEMRCPTLACSNPITVPGQCCKQCQAQPFETCTHQGEEYEHGQKWDGKSHCTTCSCTDGTVNCETPSCPALTCTDPVKVKGQCCRICLDDYRTCAASDGTRRKHGEEWKDSDCVTCTCDDGTTSCTTLKCPKLSCTSSVRDEGQCCPRCPTDPTGETCRVKSGKEYLSGQSWSKGPCRTCSCDAGNKNCETDTCPVLSCSDPEKVADECCKRCPDEIPVCLATGGTSYKHGETWQPDTCKTCKCQEGTTICSDTLCPKPACDNPVKVEGECCPQCPGVPPPKPCKDSHQTRAHGENWQETPCKSCSCSYGRIDCEAEICPTLTCTDTVKVEGACCSRCKEDAEDCPNESGAPYKHGETVYPDPCTRCHCYDKVTVCTTKSCDPVDCENPITLSNECCPRCPGDPIPAPCKFNGEVVTSGEWWRENSCKSCRCNNGIVSCATETCPLLTCPNTVKVPGQCCRICIDEPDTGCMVDGRRMQTGETFRQSPCTSCTCFFGSLECDLTVCTEPNCDNPVKAHDECCPRCPEELVPVPCTFRDKTYRSGDSFTKGPCKTCTCQNGKLSCENQLCPTPACANPTTLLDECCLKCPDELKPCKVDNVTEYDHATSFKRGDCETCSCDNGVITCDVEVCPVLECTEPISQEGKCCDRCPGVRVPDDCTTKTGQKMRHGQRWRKNRCKTCMCDNGKVRCDKETCPALTCDKPLKREADECCRKCPPDPDYACSAADGTTYMPREKWNPDTCTECECTELGGVQCDKVPCPALDCVDPLTVEGQCCKTCDPDAIIKPLVYCTATRKEGDVWRPTPCAKCTCRKGEIKCEQEKCDTLDCTDVIKIPGDCCARCSSDIKKCKTADGTSRKQGDYWRPNNCEECLCDGGMVQCRPITCDTEPTCNNPQAVAGLCCPVCPRDNFDGCDISRNRRINHGETVKLDDCRTCTCTDGRFECAEEFCDALNCEKSIKREGECCASCPVIAEEGDCSQDGVVYRSGDFFEDPADKCLRCLCTMGEVVCGQPGEECPAVECAFPIVEEGECCPTCAEGVCEYHNKLYKSGDRWNPTDCEKCECNMGIVGCTLENCPIQDCLSGLVKIPGRCCLECRDNYRTCMDKSGMYDHGDKWTKADDICVECFCDDSAICCEHILCPTPLCQNPVDIPGQCCPTCDLSLVAAGCTHNGVSYGDGETFTDQCDTCECTNGVVTCQRTGCPQLLCPHPVQSEGQCCPSCGATCFHNGAEYHDGQNWTDASQPCFTCNCKNGLVRCGRECPRLRCHDAKVKDDDCCPKCPDITFGRARLQLSGTVNNYVLNMIIGIQNVEQVIQGPDLWRVKIWSSTKSTGGGSKSNLVKQALNKAQSSQTIDLSDSELRFENLEYVRDLGGQPCTAFTYVCIEFYMTRDGHSQYTTSLLYGQEIASGCLNAC